MRLTSVFIGCTLGNFIYQWGAHQDYGAALERSYFIGLALALVWVVDKISGAQTPQESASE
jgi:hypothetical protein